MRVAHRSELTNHLKHYNESFGRRVITVFQAGAVMCCELDGGIVVGGQIAKEHGDVEIVLALISELPASFDPLRRIPHPLDVVIAGRKFRGFVVSSEAGDVSLDFGRYRIGLIRRNRMAVLEVGSNTMDSCDLPEDLYLSIPDQLLDCERRAKLDPRFA